MNMNITNEIWKPKEDFFYQIATQISVWYGALFLFLDLRSSHGPHALFLYEKA